MKELLQKAYLDWVNHFMSRARYAEHYGITIEQANLLIDLGRQIHEDIVAGK